MLRAWMTGVDARAWEKPFYNSFFLVAVPLQRSRGWAM